MVDANHVIQLEAVPHPAHPPCVSGLPVTLPAVERVAPHLTVGGEGIRRTACDGGRLVLAVQLEQVGMRPHVCTVRRNVNGDIADDLNMLCVGVGFQPRPLLVELILQILMKLHVEVKLPVVVVDGEIPVHPDVLRPALEGHFLEEALQRHEEGVIVQPPCVVGTEFVEAVVLCDAAPLIGLVEECQTVFVELVEVNFRRVAAEIHGIALLAGQNALLDEGVQTDEIRVARKGGERLIGRVVGQTVGGRTQRQDLPVTLSGLFQPVHKRIGSFVKTADAVLRRQTGDRQENTCVTVHWVSTPFSILAAEHPCLIGADGLGGRFIVV